MSRKLIACLWLVMGAPAVHAQDAPGSDDAEPAAERASQPEAPPADAPAQSGPGQVKTLAGMSILGNEEAPKSLVIVPWKSSEIGDGIGVDDAVDERARPVDKDVFLREVHYYELRSGGGS